MRRTMPCAWAHTFSVPLISAVLNRSRPIYDPILERSAPYAVQQRLGGGRSAAYCAHQAFFFTNFELNRRGVPSGFSVGGSSGVDFGRTSEAARIRNVLVNR